MAALRVRLFICEKTNAAHRPRAPVPTRTLLRVKIQRGSPARILLRYRHRPPGTAVTASALTSRLILAAPRSTGVQKASKPRPGYTLTRTGGWPGVCTKWTRCMRLKMRMFLSRRTILPHTPPTPQKQKKPGQHYPGLLTTISRALASAKAHHDHPQAHLAAQGRASASRQKEAFDAALFK